MAVALSSPRGPGHAADGAGFSHLTFDSARGLAGKSEARDRLRTKLMDVGQRFVGFDKVIEGDTVKRKQQDTQMAATVQEGLLKLERAMNAEIRRRVDANKQVHALTETLAHDMLERLQASILVRIEKLATSIETLTQRCIALERGISQFRGEMPSKLQVETAALVKDIAEMRKLIDVDHKQRVDRDETMLRRLAEMERFEAVQFDSGSAQLARTCEQLRNEVDRMNNSSDVGDSRTEKFRAFILEEIAGMKHSLAVSAQTREQTDDEIVHAMNQYTNALQKGLHSAGGRGA